MIKTDMTNEQYHAHEAISSSDVKAVHSTSAYHWLYKTYKRSAAFDLGTAVHALILEPHADLIVRGPEDRRGNKWKEEAAAAEMNGQLLLTEADYDKSRAIADAVISTPVGQTMQSERTINEASIFATCSHTGLQIKTRPDSYWQERGIIYDVKTTQDASPIGLGREVVKYNYALQAAFYLHVCREAGLPAKQFVFAAVEKEPPYATCVHMLSDDYIAWGHSQMLGAMEQIKTAQDSGEYNTGWPALNILDLPRWMSADDDFDTEN